MLIEPDTWTDFLAELSRHVTGWDVAIEVMSENGDFYDAETKLTGNSSSETQYLVPDDLGEAVFVAMEHAALDFGDICACRGAYRNDFVVSDGQP